MDELFSKPQGSWELYFESFCTALLEHVFKSVQAFSTLLHYWWQVTLHLVAHLLPIGCLDHPPQVIVKHHCYHLRSRTAVNRGPSTEHHREGHCPPGCAAAIEPFSETVSGE